MNQTQSQSKAFKRTKSLELSRWYMGIVLTNLVEKKDNRGEFSLLEATLVPGTEPPPHVHSREDELVYVVQGKLIARVGDARVEVGPGAYAALPRGVPHTIEVVSDQATLLLSFVPGGLERFLVPPKGEQPDPASFGLTFP